MAYSGSYGGLSHSCRSYCNISGYYSPGFSCAGLFCCGSSNVRFCCSNVSLDISNAYPEKCRCALSSCSYLSWDVLLPCIAAALFVFLMVTICCCQGCRSCVKCRQVIRRQCLRSNSATVSTVPGTAANLEEGQRTAGDSAFPNLPPYEFGPPKYESLELTEAPPKYEDIMTAPGQSEAHVNSAFVGDSVTPDYSRAPDYSVTSDCTVTDDSHSHDPVVPGTSGPQQVENDSSTSGACPVTANSKALALRNTVDMPCQRLQANQMLETSLNQSAPSHELAPSADTEVSTSPSHVAFQEASSTPQQVRGTPGDANWEISQVVARTESGGRTQEETV